MDALLCEIHGYHESRFWLNTFAPQSPITDASIHFLHPRVVIIEALEINGSTGSSRLRVLQYYD